MHPNRSNRHDELVVRARGAEVLGLASVNRDLAFTHAERAALGIEALLPSRVMTLDEQVAHARAQVMALPRPIDRYVALSELEARNAVLFYAVLAAHVEEMLPLVYTPTVGEACQRWSEIARRPRGVWITPDHAGRVREVLGSAKRGRVRLAVMTDNERILGLGDLGVGGMCIPVGKLAIYTVAGGIHPSEVLPISLDVGTDNAALLADPGYVGWRGKRLRGAAYDALVDETVEALRALYPGMLLQFEDFKKGNAVAILERYRERTLSFNDDIEGTAAVGLAGVLAAARKTGIPMREQRVVILGAGAAGIGIAKLIRRELAAQGLSGDALVRAIAVLDSKGMLVEGRAIDDAFKVPFAWPRALVREAGMDPDGTLDLGHVVRALSPTALIGTSGQPGAFAEDVVRTMAERTSMPAIFPLSNPNSASEADPRCLVEWTDGNAVVASGSPFPDVDHRGALKRIAQANNVWIFPGVGAGALAAEASRVTEGMFVAAAHALADAVTDADLADGALFPQLPRLAEIAVRVARSVARAAVADGVSKVPVDELDARIEAERWAPRYPALRIE